MKCYYCEAQADIQCHYCGMYTCGKEMCQSVHHTSKRHFEAMWDEPHQEKEETK